MTRPLPGYPGYAVTDDGSVLGKAGRPLRPRAHWRTGHLRVRVYGPAAAPRAVMRGERVHASRFVDLYVHVAQAASGAPHRRGGGAPRRARYA